MIAAPDSDVPIKLRVAAEGRAVWLPVDLMKHRSQTMRDYLTDLDSGALEETPILWGITYNEAIKYVNYLQGYKNSDLASIRKVAQYFEDRQTLRDLVVR